VLCGSNSYVDEMAGCIMFVNEKKERKKNLAKRMR
jgi:hypothetical protein